MANRRIVRDKSSVVSSIRGAKRTVNGIARHRTPRGTLPRVVLALTVVRRLLGQARVLGYCRNVSIERLRGEDFVSFVERTWN